MDEQTTARTELPPTETAYFYRAKGEPEIGRVIFGLAGVCRALDREQPSCGDYDAMVRMTYLATAAAVLADQLEDRLTSGSHQERRRKPKLRTVADAAGGAA